MKKIGLISFAVFFITSSQAVSGAWWWPPETATIVPQNPTSSDVVVITLSGDWHDSCTPNGSAISVSGNNIYFDVIWDYPPDIGCFAVITPWALTRSVGPLSPGTYKVYVRLLGYPYVPPIYTLMTEFIVIAESHVDTVYYVNAVDGNNLNDGLSPETSFATIQKGIDTAKSGDTIIVAPGIYIGKGNRDINFYCKAITVRSVDPTDPNIVACTIVDCNGAGDGFNFHSNEGPNSVLAGLSITKGTVGIRCSDYSCPTITNCIITNNCASMFAIGISCENSSPTIINCTVSDNSAQYGHGIYACDHSNITIMNCTITNNLSDHGGGVRCEENGSLTITDSTIRGNSATFRGGGVCVRSLDAVTIKNCIISDNTANSYCGGGFFSYGSSIVIANCTFSNNSAPNGNALAFDSWYSPHPSNVQLKNCILWNGGNEIWNDDGSTIRITYSDTWGGWPGEGNIDIDPCFADAYNGDYHLRSQAGRWNPNSGSWVKDDVTSPCIDAGDPASPIGFEPFPNGGIINMGAYGGTDKASKSYFGKPVCETIVAGDINGDCKVDFKDFALMVFHWLEER